MISNNSGDQIVPAAKAAHDKGIKVVTWDSPIPSAEGEDVFVAQVDFTETGKVMADMALEHPRRRRRQVRHPLGFARRRQPERLDRGVEGRPQGSRSTPSWSWSTSSTATTSPRRATTQALALVDKYPDMKLIMAPTSVGIVAAAKAMQDEKLCDKVKVSGLGLPTEMVAYTKNGCAPEFALWSFVDLGYLDLLHRLPARHRRHRRPRKARSSRPAAWATTPSPRTRPATRACAS